MDKENKQAGKVSLSVFISYSRKDLKQADAIVAALEKEGFDVIIDRRDLLYGEEWQVELADFIRAADTVIWLVSPHSVVSRWCLWELEEGRRLNKRIIPVAVGLVPPEELPQAVGRIHVLPVGDIFNLKKHFGDLCTALNTDRIWLMDHTRLADRARQWRVGEKSRDLLLIRSALADAEGWRDRQPATSPNPTDEILDLIFQSRCAHSRHQRLVSIVSITIAVAALALSGVAFWQKQIAETQRERAEATLRTATGAANRMVFDLALKFKKSNVPGPIVRSVLEEAKGLQDTLNKSFPTDAALQRSRAAALTELGEIYVRQENLEKAEGIHLQALRIRRRLLSHDKTNVQSRRNIPVSLNRLGDIKLKVGDRVAALAHYQEGLVILRTLVSEDKSNAKWQRDLSVSLEKIGDLKLRGGDPSGAQEAYDEMLVIRRKLLAGDKSNPQRRADISTGLEKFGNMKLREGHLSGALSTYRESLEIARALMMEEKDNPQWQHDVSIKLNKIGDVLRRSKEPGDARKVYEESLIINRALSKQDKSNARWQRGVFVALSKIGDVDLQAGQVQTARQKFEEGLKIAQTLAARDESNTQWQRDISVTLERLGDVQLQLNNNTHALKEYQESLNIRQRLVALDKGNMKWQRDLSVSFNKVGDLKIKSGDVQGGIQAFERGLKIDRMLASSDNGNVQWKIDLVISLATLAQAGAKPRKNYSEAIDILNTLKKKNLLSARQSNWIDFFKSQCAC